jgi:hypothetical protein
MRCALLRFAALGCVVLYDGVFAVLRFAVFAV